MSGISGKPETALQEDVGKKTFDRQSAALFANQGSACEPGRPSFQRLYSYNRNPLKPGAFGCLQRALDTDPLFFLSRKRTGLPGP